MEKFLIKREPYLSQDIEEIVNIDNHLLADEKPNQIKLEYIDNNSKSLTISSEKYSEIKQELDYFYEDHPIQEFENVNLVAEETVYVDNHSLINKKINNIKLENIDQSSCCIPIYSDGKYFEVKQELDRSNEDFSKHNVDNAISNFSLLRLKNVTVVLERLSTVQILKYTKKSETNSEYTYRLNVDVIKYVCKYSCSKCNRTVDTKNIRHIINRPECGCIPTMAYQCMGCNKQFVSYLAVQRHVNQKGLCKSRKKFLNLEGINDDDWEKLNCPKCNVSLENIAQFVKHVNACEEVPKFWCSLCDFRGKWIAPFRVHLKLHANQLNTQSERGTLKTVICYCSTCNETIVQKGFRMLSSTCNKCRTPYTYRCSRCNNKYSTYAIAKRHIKICKTYKEYHCSICKENKFESFHLLQNHMSHCGKTTYINYKFCPYKTNNRGLLMKHLKTHYENYRSLIDQARVEGSYNAGPVYDLFCEKCIEPKESGEYRNNRYHCLRCKTKLLLHCQKCNVVYRYRSRMMAHVTVSCGLDIGQKLRQKCPKCDRQFMKLNLHIQFCRDPTEDRTYYCAHCPCNTKRRSYIIRHLNNKHQNEF